MRLSRITAATDRQVAHHLATRLLAGAEGPTDEPATWERYCQERGISVRYYRVPGGCPGEWTADIVDGEPAVVAINTAYRPRSQARAFVHELAELLMYRMQPPLLSDLCDGGRYDGDMGSTQHRIARIVERLVVDITS